MSDPERGKILGQCWYTVELESRPRKAGKEEVHKEMKTYTVHTSWHNTPASLLPPFKFIQTRQGRKLVAPETVDQEYAIAS